MPRSGHAPGHVRDTFDAAIYAFVDWNSGEPEPTVEYEINYVPRQIPLSKACGLLWGCTDILPGHLFDYLNEGLEASRQEPPQRRTYAACARAMLQAIQTQKAAA